MAPPTAADAGTLRIASNRGDRLICPRCDLGIGPDDLWDLGHDDYNPGLERPEHRACNRAAANQLKTSREW